ncbi:trehalase family glycosidase [Pararobbsia silviterrae]|nr:trehalase family glycosidase [Pararobbsia silviterrae]
MIRPLSARALLCPLLLVVCCTTHASSEPSTSTPPPPPSVLYGPLFAAVQNARLFSDERTFADMAPVGTPDRIVSGFERMKSQRGFNLGSFVFEHFLPPRRARPPAPADPRIAIDDHIDALWTELARPADLPSSPDASWIAVPRPYLAPSPRFDDVRYWESYFVMLGLDADGRRAQVDDQIDDIAALIDRFGYMPASNRTYDLSHSGPPFFSLMVDLVARHEGPAAYVRYRPALEREYAYWMDGASQLPSDTAWRRAIRLSDGTVLNRYWDDRAAPRDTSYRSDLLLASHAGSPFGKRAESLFRNLRAADESGWALSSRWVADGQHVATLRTTSLVPVDLNALLYHLEVTLARGYRETGDRAHAENLLLRAAQRKAAIERLMWDPKIDAFADLDWTSGKLTHILTAATVYPLFLRTATPSQAAAVAQTVRDALLAKGGVMTTTIRSPWSWDAPYGWAPIQWMAVTGFNQYHFADLARTIAKRWVQTSLDTYAQTGRLSERYDVVDPSRNAALIANELSAETGAPSVVHGVGWSAGVLRAMLAAYPEIASTHTRGPDPRLTH